MSTSGNNNKEENPSRKGKGRRKVTMEKMENEANLQVTFSKRRNGLFKKASELSTRCGAESALLVYSPGGRPYSFGHPNVEKLTDRFLDENDQNSPPTADQLAALEAERHMIANANSGLNRAVEHLDLAMNQAKVLEQISKQVGKAKQLGEPDYEQLDQLKGEVLDFKDKFETEEGKKKYFTGGTPYTFLGPSPNIGTATQLVEPTGPSFDPPFDSNLQGFPNQFPHYYDSGGIRIFGSNVSLPSYDPHFVGSSTTNFFPPPGYIPMWNADSVSFVIPYTPLATNLAATFPDNPTENEPSGHVTGNNAGGAGKDRDEQRFSGNHDQRFQGIDD